MIIKNNTTIETDIYVKPNDSKQYLPYTSCHPKHTKINMPFNLATRVLKIVSNSDVQKVRLEELKTNLVKQGYPTPIIEMGFQKALDHGTDVILGSGEAGMDVVPFVHTYHPHLSSGQIAFLAM